MLVLLVSGIFVGSKLVIFAQKIIDGRDGFSIRKFLIGGDKPLAGQDQGEVRILLLGIGGENHDGGTLTDTMILATIKTNARGGKNEVSLFSIPRDLYVEIPGQGMRKINSAYALGELNQKKQGPALAVATAEHLLDVKIPYYAVVDFQGFEKVIDELEGITVNVPVTFTDAQFPDEKQGYLPPLTFKAGQQQMDGQRALQYVRSRHGNNGQGSDFARAGRQQLVLKALKDKTTSLKVLTNLSLVNRILDTLSDHVRTNLAVHEMKAVYNLTHGTDDHRIFSQAIDGESGLVCDRILEDGAYVLVPCQGDYTAIRKYFANQFVDAGVRAEEPAIEIMNAATVPALGKKVQDTLALPHLKITIGNYTGEIKYTQSIIYDNTRGQKPETLEYLKKTLNLPVAQSPFPARTSSFAPDFVIMAAEDIDR